MSENELGQADKCQKNFQILKVPTLTVPSFLRHDIIEFSDFFTDFLAFSDLRKFSGILILVFLK